MSLSGLAQGSCDITKMLKNALARLWEGSGLSIIVARSEITKKTVEGSCKEI